MCIIFAGAINASHLSVSSPCQAEKILSPIFEFQVEKIVGVETTIHSDLPS